MADAKHQAICVPMPIARARRYIRTHQRITEAVRKKPAISHQPPSCNGGKISSPYLAGGGSSDKNGSILMKRRKFQSSAAHMFRPMISKAVMPQAMDISPVAPR
jgi:hypothetical protein